jgi:hypothetical protein
MFTFVVFDVVMLVVFNESLSFHPKKKKKNSNPPILMAYSIEAARYRGRSVGRHVQRPTTQPTFDFVNN